MTIKERLESSPFLYFISAVISAVGITIAVDNYFWNKKMEFISAKNDYQINIYESQLASIKRNIEGSKAIDIESILIKRNQTSEIPANSKFFASWDFYAPDTNDYWNHQYLQKYEIGLNFISDKIIAQFGENGLENLKARLASRKSPLNHFWNEKNPTIITTDHAKFFPHILLSRTSISDYHKEEAEKPSSHLGSITENIFMQGMENQQQMYKKLSKIKSSNDRTKPMMQSMEIVSLKKHNNILHYSLLMTFNSVNVNNVIFDRYYSRIETIVIVTSNYIYTIQAHGVGPEPAPRGKIYSELTKWLAGLKIIEN